MEDLIKNIIDRAKSMRTNPEITDYDIAQFVHIELGKVMYYDNNYSAKLENGKGETELSSTRKSNMLRADTDKSKKAQICKGMAEIYAEILNEVGIEARAIGIEKKGETQELSQDEAKHYCAIFKIGEQKYVQDYLMESALMRIKIGEAEIAENMPGISPIEEYKERGPRSLMQTDLSHEYLDRIFGENMIDLNDGQRFDLIFEKLNQYFRDTETEFGFEEAKDFVFLAGKNFIRTKPKIINLVRENESECGFACIYEIDGKKYLVRGGDESSDIQFPAGEISNSDFAEILNQGYEGRSQEERKYIVQDRGSYKENNMSSKECFHFTYLNRAFSIREKGLTPRIEDNSKAVKDSSDKVSFSDGRYAVAALMANFYRVYTDIKTGKRDKDKTDPDLEKRVIESESFEDFLGEGMYFIFDGTDIENTGGNKGHINPFDAGTKESIEPDKLKVCMLRNEQTGELSYSKFDFAQYLMMNLTQDDYSKMPDGLISDIEYYKENHSDEMNRFKNSEYSIEFMTLDDFCQVYKKEIDEDIKKQETKRSKCISIKDVVKNAISNGIATEQVAQMDRAQNTLSNERNIERE